MAARARLSNAQARRVALSAQGLGASRPSGRIDVRHWRSVLHRLGVVQIDSVNVLTRAHHLPFFARLGPYDRATLDRYLWGSGEAFEYLGHEAALLPVAHHRLMRHRMVSTAARYTARLDAESLAYAASVLAEIVERGQLTSTELLDGGRRTGPWWGLSRGKRALRFLYGSGEVAVADRRTNFVTVYDLPERVLPAPALASPSPDPEGAHRELVLEAARAHGVGTLADLADYHRLARQPARDALGSLIADGLVEPVSVEGSDQAHYLHAGAVVPRRLDARALLSPFDPVVWFRPRVERLFGFHYRIEIYVPEAERRYGYYVLPFLLGDSLVARVDLKADRSSGVLQVRGAYVESGHEPMAVAGPLAEELRTMATWLGLGAVSVHERGDLALPLRRMIATASDQG